MAKKVILRFKTPATADEMKYYSKTVKEGLEDHGVILVNSNIEVYVVEDGDEIEIKEA